MNRTYPPLIERQPRQTEPSHGSSSACVVCTDVLYRALQRTAAPWNKKTGKGEPFEIEVLTDTELGAVRDLKKKVVSPPVLALPRHGYRYILHTDARKYQVDRILLHE